MSDTRALPQHLAEVTDPTAPQAADAEGVRLSSFSKCSTTETAAGTPADPFARYGAPEEDSDGSVEAYA